jgi:cation transport ATPase
MAVWAALGAAAQRQILFRHGEALERLADVRAIRFDKTGTLTTGVAEVADAVMDVRTSATEIRGLTAGLTQGSNHVFSHALTRYLESPGDASLVEAVRTLPGRGLLARRSTDGACVLLGNLPLMREHAMSLDEAVARRVNLALKRGESFTLIGWAGRVRGVFVFREQLREGAAAALRRCAALGLDLAVLTGDHTARGKALAGELGVRAVSELLPEQKLAEISAAQRTFGAVAMVGDGVNDAPALAASDVGVAMGQGADLTRDTAAICLMSNDLARLPWAVELARRSVRIMRQNLFWAFAYNAIGILFAAAGWLNPMWAAGAMVLSSLFVVVNSLRLRGVEMYAPAVDGSWTTPDMSATERPVEEAAV